MADFELTEPRRSPLNPCPMCGERRRVVANDTEAADWRCYCTRSPDEPVFDPMPIDSEWQQDVLALIPPTESVLLLEGVWQLAPDCSPLEQLRLWQPTDKGDQCLRRFLLAFGHRVLAAERRNSNV